MSVVINTNSDALRIQNTLTSATDKLSQTMQRMSSGLKINSAKDDAAGTVIAARMGVQLDGNKICQQNIQNANSLLSTAEGNIDVVLDNVSRIRDLTLQAKNGTYSTEEKEAMQNEVAQRMAEIDRVSDSAKFSQLKLFGGTELQNGATFQVGANSSDDNTINVTNKDNIFSSVKFTDLLTKTTEGKEYASIAADGVTVAATLPTGDALAALDVGKIYYQGGSFHEVVEDEEGVKSFADADGFKLSADAGALDESIDLGTPAEGVYTVEDIDAGTAEKGTIYKVVNDDESIDYYLCTDVVEQEVEQDEDPLDTYSFVKITDSIKTEDVEPGKEKAYASNDAFNISTMTQDDFVQALDALDGAIDDLTARKSAIGSFENRLGSALNTLTTQYTNLTSAKSIITDADIASEASAYTQNQILQQVTTSLLSQANQAPSVALSLL